LVNEFNALWRGVFLHMSRLIFLIAVVALIYLLIRAYRKRSPTKKLAAEDMVQCAHCGMHFPSGEGVQSGELFFCGTDHRDVYHD